MTRSIALLTMTGFFLSLAFTPAAGAWLRALRSWDTPNERSSHAVPTVRGAGIGPALAWVIVVSAGSVFGSWRFGLALGVIAFTGLGLLEDLRGLPVAIRLVAQMAVAAVVLVMLPRLLPDPWPWRAAATIATIVWITAFVNVFNFMDGLNGVSVFQSVVAGISWAFAGQAMHLPVMTALGLLLAAVAVGFGPFNFPNARVFLGDAGSYFFGMTLAVVALIGLRSHMPPESVLAPLVIYLADTSSTLLRRVRRGDPWFKSHREHVYQRLNQLGLSHAKTASILAGWQIGCAGLGLVSITSSVPARALCDAALGVLVAAYVISPGLVARRLVLKATSPPSHTSQPRPQDPA
jgi:UDP-GlcNAc:undecaprenyl-phosphate/decaprenyl-phosphate GlcNAc-1-phosphate transferase